MRSLPTWLRSDGGGPSVAPSPHGGTECTGPATKNFRISYESKPPGLELQCQGIMRTMTRQPQGRLADSREDALHEAGGAVVAREFPACRKECEFAAGTRTGMPQAARQAGRRFDRRACGCKKSWFAWSRVPVPKPYCGLVGKRPSLSLTPRPVEIL